MCLRLLYEWLHDYLKVRIDRTSVLNSSGAVLFENICIEHCFEANSERDLPKLHFLSDFSLLWGGLLKDETLLSIYVGLVEG